MDSITQAALGAATCSLIAPGNMRKRAMLTGIILGTLPDLDVLFRYANVVENFTRHRGFSHSVFVLPLLAWLLLPLGKKIFYLSGSTRGYFILFLPLFTHPLLDSLTSYGTQLFWPLSFSPVCLASVYIVDPCYTFWLLTGLLGYFLHMRLSWLNTLGIVLSTIYLLLGFVLQGQARHIIEQHFPEAKISSTFVTPLTAGPFCWRGVIVGDNEYREVIFSLRKQQISSQTYTVLPREEYPSLPVLDRLLWFNPEFLVLRKSGNNLVATDLRMGGLGKYIFNFVLDPNGGQPPVLKKDVFFLPARQNKEAEKIFNHYRGLNLFERQWQLWKDCCSGKDPF